MDIHSDIHSPPRDYTQSYPQPRDASSTVPLEGGSARTNLADEERAVSWRNGVVCFVRWPGRRRKVNPFVARFRPVLGIFGRTLPGGSVSRETSAVAATPTAYFTPSNILGYSHLRPFRPRCPPIFPQSYPQQYPPANWLSEPVVMAAKFDLGRYRFNPLRQTRNRRYRVLEITGDSSMTSTLRRHAVSRRYLLTVLPVLILAMPYKPDEQLPSRYRRPRLRVQPPRAGEPASGVWSPPCGSAVHVLGSKIRTRFSPGRRPGAGVRGPVSVVRRPASGGKCPGAGIRRPGASVRGPASDSGFRFRSSEVRGPKSEVVGETLHCAALKRPCLLGAEIRQLALGLQQACCPRLPALCASSNITSQDWAADPDTWRLPQISTAHENKRPRPSHGQFVQATDAPAEHDDPIESTLARTSRGSAARNESRLVGRCSAGSALGR